MTDAPKTFEEVLEGFKDDPLKHDLVVHFTEYAKAVDHQKASLGNILDLLVAGIKKEI